MRNEKVGFPYTFRSKPTLKLLFRYLIRMFRKKARGCCGLFTSIHDACKRDICAVTQDMYVFSQDVSLETKGVGQCLFIYPTISLLKEVVNGFAIKDQNTDRISTRRVKLYRRHGTDGL